MRCPNCGLEMSFYAHNDVNAKSGICLHSDEVSPEVKEAMARADTRPLAELIQELRGLIDELRTMRGYRS